jgi:hypothetical protein
MVAGAAIEMMATARAAASGAAARKPVSGVKGRAVAGAFGRRARLTATSSTSTSSSSSCSSSSVKLSAAAPSRAGASIRVDGGSAARRGDTAVTCASGGDQNETKTEEKEADAGATAPEGVDDDFTLSGTVRRKRAAAAASAGKKKDFSVDDINPLEIGRRSRALVDGFFKQIASLTQIQRSPSIDEVGLFGF